MKTRFAAALAVLMLSVALAGAAEHGSITGTIKKADGSAAADTQVQIFSMNGQPERGRKPEATATTKTDANGNFKLENVPAGSYRLIAGVPFIEMGMANVTVKAGAATKVNVTIRARGAK